MSLLFSIGRAGARYTHRIIQKPLNKVGEFLREVTPDAESAAYHANFFAQMLLIAYEYYERGGEDACYKRRWKNEYGYEVIPSTEFADPDVKKLLQSRMREAVALRRIRDESQTSSDPDDIVVLLRGTCFSSWRDILDDLKIMCEVLHWSKRFKDTEKLVKELVDQQIERYGRQSVRIVGHSLGAAIGFIIARRLHLEHPYRSPEGHFFNLPFMDIESLFTMATSMFEIEAAIYKTAMKIFHGSPLGALIGLTAKKVLRRKTIEEFDKLDTFKPNIYLNGYDRVCNGYISYFKNRAWGSCSSGVTKLTGVLSILGCDIRSEHMCPSATLIISWRSFCTVLSHSLEKWKDVGAESLRVEGCPS